MRGLNASTFSQSLNEGKQVNIHQQRETKGHMDTLQKKKTLQSLDIISYSQETGYRKTNKSQVHNIAWLFLHQSPISSAKQWFGGGNPEHWKDWQ